MSSANRWSSPLVKRHLSSLADSEFRDHSLRSLRLHVREMEPTAVPRLLHHVTGHEDRSTSDFAVSLFSDAAEAHGPLILPEVPRMVESMLKQMGRPGSSDGLRHACAAVTLQIIRTAPRTAEQTAEVVGSMCAALCAALGDPSEGRREGGAACLMATVSSEKWKYAPEDTVALTWRSAVDSVQSFVQTLPQLQLARALVRTNHTEQLQLHAPTLLRASMGMLVGAAAWQQRLYSLKLAREVVTRCSQRTFDAEVGAVEATLRECQDERMSRMREEVAVLLRIIHSLQESWVPSAFVEDFPRNFSGATTPTKFRPSPSTSLTSTPQNLSRQGSGSSLDLLLTLGPPGGRASPGVNRRASPVRRSLGYGFCPPSPHSSMRLTEAGGTGERDGAGSASPDVLSGGLGGGGTSGKHAQQGGGGAEGGVGGRQTGQEAFLESPADCVDPKRLLRSLQAGTPAHERGRKGGGLPGELGGPDSGGASEVGSSSVRVASGQTNGEKKVLDFSVADGAMGVGCGRGEEEEEGEGVWEGEEEEEVLRLGLMGKVGAVVERVVKALLGVVLVFLGALLLVNVLVTTDSEVIVVPT